MGERRIESRSEDRRDPGRLGRLAAFFVLLAGALPPALPSAQDVVELNDGTKLEGRVLFESDKKVVVRVNSRERELERSEVKSVQSIARSLGTVLERWSAMTTDDPAGTLDLARYCKSHGLEGEAQVFAYRVLTAEPENEEAHLLCGHEKRGSGWVVRDGAKKHLFSELERVRKDWKEGWELRTTHYQLATNMDLAAACNLALELELLYRAFTTWFGADLGLYDVTDPMLCQVHADKGSFPELSNRVAYYDPNVDIIFELAVDGLVLEVLLHEATHQLLHNTTGGSRKGVGDIAPWLDEGLAEYMSSCRMGDPGRARYDDTRLIAQHFACHRDAKKPYDLSRILGLSTEDFAASSKADLKYAQSYTLVHFCLQGDAGAHRADFMEFLRSAYLDKGSATDFKTAMKLKERDFEKAWLAHVKRVAR